MSYKYAYLLRHASIAPDLELVGDREGTAFTYVVEEQISRSL